METDYSSGKQSLCDYLDSLIQSDQPILKQGDNMSRKYSEYVYKNSDDTIRIKIFKRTETDDKVCPWDADVFFRIQEKVETYSDDAGDYFYSKREAKEYYTDLYGQLKSIQPVDTITNGW
jgi:hypothetical protein